jgi:hypothetical protein
MGFKMKIFFEPEIIFIVSVKTFSLPSGEVLKLASSTKDCDSAGVLIQRIR